MHYQAPFIRVAMDSICSVFRITVNTNGEEGNVNGEDIRPILSTTHSDGLYVLFPFNVPNPTVLGKEKSGDERNSLNAIKIDNAFHPITWIFSRAGDV